MKRTLFKKGLAGVAALGVVAATLLTAGAPNAQAGPTKVITATGSDTSQDFMDVILNGTGNNYNLHALILPNPGGTQTIPGDADCASKTYTSDPGLIPPNLLAPNGSGAGRDALKAQESAAAGANGCFDIARSSGAPRAIGAGNGKDSATMEYYAFALDAVGWSSTSLLAPATMTLDQLRSVYNCTFTDWAQVGGSSGPIQRYQPQPGSGTRSFFQGVLGFDPATFSNVGCPAVIDTQLDNSGLPLEENHLDQIDNAGYQKAIAPHSAGQWAFQANLSINPTLDHRRGGQLKSLTATRTVASIATTSGSSTLTAPANNTFFGLDTGASVTGAGIPANAKIVSVATNGKTAVMSSNATATGSATLTLLDLAANPVNWNGTGGLFQPNTSSPLNPRGPIAESNVAPQNVAVAAYPGVRYIYNVLDTPLPGYSEARGIVGFNNVGGGVKSPLCDGSNFSDILSYGFGPLPSTTPSSVDPSKNLAASTCRKFTP